MAAFQVRLDDEQHQQLRQLAFREGVSLNQLVRIAVGHLLDMMSDKGSNGDSD